MVGAFHFLLHLFSSLFKFFDGCYSRVKGLLEIVSLPPRGRGKVCVHCILRMGLYWIVVVIL